MAQLDLATDFPCSFQGFDFAVIYGWALQSSRSLKSGSSMPRFSDSRGRIGDFYLGLNPSAAKPILLLEIVK